jgi:hypothetical protein
MTREDIIEMTREAQTHDPGFSVWILSTPHLERIVRRAMEAEREACKKLAQEHAAEYRVGGRLYAPLGENYALCAAVACDHIVHLIEERGK